jgi:hypothetical protein
MTGPSGRCKSGGRTEVMYFSLQMRYGYMFKL